MCVCECSASLWPCRMYVGGCFCVEKMIFETMQVISWKPKLIIGLFFTVSKVNWESNPVLCLSHLFYRTVLLQQEKPNQQLTRGMKQPVTGWPIKQCSEDQRIMSQWWLSGLNSDGKLVQMGSLAACSEFNEKLVCLWVCVCCLSLWMLLFVNKEFFSICSCQFIVS